MGLSLHGRNVCRKYLGWDFSGGMSERMIGGISGIGLIFHRVKSRGNVWGGYSLEGFVPEVIFSWGHFYWYIQEKAQWGKMYGEFVQGVCLNVHAQLQVSLHVLWT